MPKCLISYFSQSGTTVQIAERIADGLRKSGYEVDLYNILSEQEIDLGDYDVLGIGSPVYYYRPPFVVTDYINNLSEANGLPAFTFISFGAYNFDACTQLRSTLRRKGLQDTGCFKSYGPASFLGYHKAGYLFSPEHPTPDELSRAEAFGCEVAARLAGMAAVTHEEDTPALPIYRLERFLTNRWFIKYLYTMFFRANAKKCQACGQCIKECPTKNITRRSDGRPSWGRNCILCFMCQSKCSNDAISSVVSWPVFRVLINYNVKEASHDPGLSYARVTHERGKTKHI